MKSLFFFFIVLSVTCFAQLDTLDRVDLKNNQTYTGKVIKVTSSTVQFRESITNLLHEFNKSEIRDMKLSNGVTVTFDNTAPQEQQQNVTGSARTETQTLNPPPTQNTPTQSTQTQSTQTQNPPAQNTQTQNPPVQNPPAQNTPPQGQTVNSGGTQTGTTTGQTENKGQQSQNTQNAAAPADDGGSSGMDTSKIIVLAAGGLVVLLLIGALIF